MVYSFGKLNNSSFKSVLRRSCDYSSIFNLNGEAEYSNCSVSKLVTPLLRFF